ncbi:hypothetical protein J6590_057238 [Homalodisca vitripennis]|nr:hypothetical protein J6590_057238 [Homalodisca vitripennis]
MVQKSEGGGLKVPGTNTLYNEKPHNGSNSCYLCTKFALFSEASVVRAMASPE